MTDINQHDSDNAKSALAKELAQDVLDYGRILELAHDLSQEDSGAIRFSVDASHISRLGLELVSKQETAISELIKNAFDADAYSVKVVFEGTDLSGGVLEVIDSGAGMSREQLIKGFMRISTASKVSEPRSPIYGRQRAGRKGIGRFAAQRLGRRLHISTQLKDATHSLLLTIDWEKFSTGLDLHMISNEVVERPIMEHHGTVIRIEDLRDSWSEAQIRRAYRFVSDLLQPFPLERTSKSELAILGKYSPDPGFDVEFFKVQDGHSVKVASHEQNILSNAVGHITAKVADGGQAFVTLTSELYPVDYTDIPLVIDSKTRARGNEKVENYKMLDGVNLTAHYFIQDELPSGTRGMVRDVLTRTGGIRVYRNGFRVLPYGESFDDWLTLQRSSALRELLPPHHNTNFLGFIEISDVDGARFQETASREGLIENEAFFQLQDFAYRAIVAGVVEVARVRKRKLFAGDKAPYKPDERKPTPQSVKDKASHVADQLRALAESASPSPIVKFDESQPQLDFDEGAENHSQATAKALEQLADEIDEIGSNSLFVLEEVGMLRVLASLGLTIGEFTHEVRHALAALGVIIEELGNSPIQSSVAQELSDHVLLLRGYMRYFDDAVTQNAHRKLEVHELRDVIGEFVAVVRPTFTRQNVDVQTKFTGYDLFTRPMHKSEWASTLLNLFTNSLKAIQRAQVPGKILIESKVSDNYLQVDFSDNGDGIPLHNREKAFEAFFTTSSPPSASASHDQQLVGTGLGLKIVKDIIESGGGYIEAIDPSEGYATCIRLSIPRAREDQINDEQY